MQYGRRRAVRGPAEPGYRLIASLGSEPPALLAIDGESQSGHPGSPHYADQLKPWLEGSYHELVLERPQGPVPGDGVLVLEPAVNSPR